MVQWHSRCAVVGVAQVLTKSAEALPARGTLTPCILDEDPEQLDALTRVIKEAALKGIEIAMTHSVQVLMGSIYDLCTSKLHTYQQ